MPRARSRLRDTTLLTIALALGAAAPSRAAVILDYCGYIGGDRWDELERVAVDGAGSAYVVGATASTEATFPVGVGPDLSFNGGSTDDAFVAKVKVDGSGLVYCGYIGGDEEDQARAVVVDASGSAYVAGYTDSSQVNFPVIKGPDLTFNGPTPGPPYGDVFVAKLRPDGAGLIFSGYIGGRGHEEGNSIAVDPMGNVYVSGEVNSPSAMTFPVRVGPDLTYNDAGANRDSYVAKVLPDGSALVYCGYIGGVNDEDEPQGLAVNPAGEAYVGTSTASTETSFPVVLGPDLSFNGGMYDGAVAKVKADGTGLVYAGYIGGDASDRSYALALDASGSAYLAGGTSSSEATFPIAVGPDLTANGSSDAWVAKVKPDGSGLVYAGFIGGSRSDSARGVAVDAVGNAYVSGATASTEATFPLRGGPDLTYNGGTQDAFAAKVSADGAALVFAGYLGGAGTDEGARIALDVTGNAYVAGYTDSTEATFPVTVGPDLTYNGLDRDAFVAKLIETACAVAPREIGLLRSVKPAGAIDDAAMQWQPDPGANGYNIWYVLRKEEIDLAREDNQPPAIGVAGCATPAPAAGAACTDQGAVPRGSPAVFFYQVRAFCDPMNEGP